MSVKVLWYAAPERRREYAELDGLIDSGLTDASYSLSPIEPDRTRRLRVNRTPDLGSDVSVAVAIARAEAALERALRSMELDDPILPALLDWYGTPPEIRPFLAQRIIGRWRLERLRAGGEAPDPWPLGRGAEPNSAIYDTPDGRGADWRPKEAFLLEAAPERFARRLIGAITLSENIDFLAEWADAPMVAIAHSARDLLSEVQPSIEASIAESIAASDPWRDTFVLWLLVRRPRALAILHPLVVALATRYGTLANQFAGIVYGTTKPFEGEPLVSATAHLGKALWVLDYRSSLLPGIVAFLRQSQRPDGGFGDPGQESDVLTTLAVADLLSRLDPTWDPEPTARWFAAMQEPAGWWRALDPEVPWLTRAILDWLRSVDRPFGERFGWPEYQRLDRDRKTGVPGYAAFDRLVRVFSELDGLRFSRTQIAFLDLAHFREFNNRFGQGRGDEILRAFAQELARIPGVLVIRDGGDEFIVVRAATATDLMERLDDFRHGWPAILRDRFGPDTPPVAPRIIVSDRANGEGLAAERDDLGNLISPVKEEYPDPGPEGVLVDKETAMGIAESRRRRHGDTP